MNTIFEGTTIGAIACIKIAYHTDFKSFAPAVFLDGKGWEGIEIAGQAELTRKIKNTPHGLIYHYGGFFDIHRISDEVENSLLKFVGRRAVLRLEDNNDRIYIIGEPNNPVLLEEESQTGKLPKHKNGYQFSFSVSQISLAPSI